MLLLAEFSAEYLLQLLTLKFCGRIEIYPQKKRNVANNKVYACCLC